MTWLALSCSWFRLSPPMGGGASRGLDFWLGAVGHRAGPAVVMSSRSRSWSLARFSFCKASYSTSGWFQIYKYMSCVVNKQQLISVSHYITPHGQVENQWNIICRINPVVVYSKLAVKTTLICSEQIKGKITRCISWASSHSHSHTHFSPCSRRRRPSAGSGWASRCFLPLWSGSWTPCRAPSGGGTDAPGSHVPLWRAAGPSGHRDLVWAKDERVIKRKSLKRHKLVLAIKKKVPHDAKCTLKVFSNNTMHL